MHVEAGSHSMEPRELLTIVNEVSNVALPQRVQDPHGLTPLLYLQFNATALASPNLRHRVCGLERLLSDTYRAPVSLFQFLNWMCLDTGEVIMLLTTRLDALVALLCEMALEITATPPHGSERLTLVIADYYGLHGQAPLTLQQIGLRLSFHFTRAHHARKRALRLFADTFTQASWWQVASQRVTELL